eukprot:150621-Rhodomonas_salina.2
MVPYARTRSTGQGVGQHLEHLVVQYCQRHIETPVCGRVVGIRRWPPPDRRIALLSTALDRGPRAGGRRRGGGRPAVDVELSSEDLELRLASPSLAPPCAHSEPPHDDDDDGVCIQFRAGRLGTGSTGAWERPAHALPVPRLARHNIR